MCMPIGKLSEYYDPSPQLGVGFGFKISPKVRCDLGMTPRFLISKKKPEFIINNAVVEANTPVSFSVGGWATYRIFRNKSLFTDLVSGLHYEPLEIDNPNPTGSKDSVLYISTGGISFGMNTWINKFGKQNFGFKVLYTYAPYNRDKMLVSNIGGHSASVSLCYKLPQRDIYYKRKYDNNYRKRIAHEPLVLQHRNKINRHKKLYLDRTYMFKTTDTTYYSKILSFTDTTVTIKRWIRGAETDTIHYENYLGKKGKDTTIVSGKYVVDTLAIPNSHILYIKKDWFKNKEWLLPFGYVALASVMGVVFLPIAALDKGREGVNEWLAFEGMLLAIWIPPVIIGTRATKYNLTKKWKIKETK